MAISSLAIHPAHIREQLTKGLSEKGEAHASSEAA